MAYDRRNRTARRRGVSTFESILVLVVLIIASFAAFQFGLALIVKQTVSHAATVAAREAAKQSPADADELVCVVNRILQEYRLQIGPDVSLVLEDPTALVPIDQRGSLTCVPPATPVLDGDEVRVTVCVSLTGGPFVNILKFYGIDYTGRTFVISSVAAKE